MCSFSEAFLNIRAENIFILVKTRLEAAARLRSLTNQEVQMLLVSLPHKLKEDTHNLVELFTMIQPQTSSVSEVDFLLFLLRCHAYHTAASLVSCLFVVFYSD